jgi:hypothetical protein
VPSKASAKSAACKGVCWSLVFMFHPAVFTYGQTFTTGLKFLQANIVLFSGLQAFCRSFVCCGHGAVAGDVFFGIVCTVLRYRISSCYRY